MTDSQVATCFGWSSRAWARLWKRFVRSRPDMHFATGLEIGAGLRSSLAPLMLNFTDRVECSVFDGATLPAIQTLNTRLLAPEQTARITYTQQDVRALQGSWDVIVLKSVLGGVYRTRATNLLDVHAALTRIRTLHLNPGGLLVTLDNGSTALEPWLTRLGARRNGWRFFRREDFPPAEAHFSFGVLGVGSAATRLGSFGVCIDDVLYLTDRLLSPLVHQHAVHLHVYQAVS